MNKKHIRTIIIFALVLIATIITVFSIDIETVDQASEAYVVSSTVVETENPQAEEKEERKEQNTEKEKETSDEEQEVVDEKEVPYEEHEVADEKEIPAKEQTLKKDVAEETKQSDVQSVPVDVKPEETTPPEPEGHFCTIEIRCDTVKDTSKLENQAVAPYVPSSGVILETSKIEFTPGESVFDILLRATKERNIHMEFKDDKVYSGKYIEGINYLYEMDGGPLSGWMYKVNGKFPNYGCAAYEVKDGDAIVWMYTCDLGVDVGDNSTW